MTMLGLTLTCALLAAGQPEEGPTRTLRTPALAETLERKIADFELRQRTGGAKVETTIPVTEGELNSYLNLSSGLRLPDGLSDVEFLFERDQIGAKGQLDLEAVRGKTKVGSGPMDPLSLLSGRIPIEVKGRIRSEAEGFGAFDIQDVRLGPVSLPVSILAEIVASATRSAADPHGFDIRAPFRLPYSLKRVRIQPGRALLDF